MLGFSALSENPISSVNKVLELSASMTGLAVSSSAAAGTLVGASTMSANSTQTSTGVRILVHSASLESSSVASSSAVFIKGSTLQTDLVSSSVQTATGVRTLVGTSTQDFNLTQTATGELLFTEIVPSVTVTYTEITHTGDNWTEITHTGDTWTDVSTNQELQMASSYTANNGIEKIGTGEQAGTWGATTNTNFDILDRAINGVGAITLSGTTHTLTTTDGALSDGHFKVLVFGGTLSSTNTVTISPNDQDKLYFVFNNTSGDQSIIIKQGSGATVTVANGKTAIVYADGAGSGAAVAQIETGSDAFTEDLTVKTGDGALLTLQTSDTTVVDGDVLGALQFQAPNESSGTDAITVAASIVAEADDTFAADSNKTDLVFKLGQSEAATEKMRLTHEGDVELQNDLTLKSDASLIKFGADSEITLTHVADTGLTLTHTATGAGTPVVLNLKSEEDAIADGDVIGKITFTAGDDSGTDAIATAASIEAEADDTFAADSNKTDLVFKLGSSEAATEKMRLAHEGVLSIPADGSTTTNGIHIGAGADLKLYHESDTNVIQSGSDNHPIAIQSHSGEFMAKFDVNDAARLYYDN